MTLAFVDPRTHELLILRGEGWVRPSDDLLVAPVIGGIPRFVDPSRNYAESFGFQWKRWRDTLSDARNTGSAKRDLILKRTHFDDYEVAGRTILECGMGGGDDTEVLLMLGFGEVHAFDISTSVERAAETLRSDRLTISQASIYEIPYPDRAFDFVFCHRVLQHTPDPVRALRAVCRKVKPGGILFAHSYRLSWRSILAAKYKLRWLTRRLPREWLVAAIDRMGPRLHRVNEWLYARGPWGRSVAEQVNPFKYIVSYGDLSQEQILEMEKLNTFDALSPRYDNPMTTRTFRRTIEEEGFLIEHFYESPRTPIFATARRRPSEASERLGTFSQATSDRRDDVAATP